MTTAWISHRIITDHGSTDGETAPGRTLFRVVLPVAGPQTQNRPNSGVYADD